MYFFLVNTVNIKYSVQKLAIWNTPTVFILATVHRQLTRPTLKSDNSSSVVFIAFPRTGKTKQTADTQSDLQLGSMSFPRENKKKASSTQRRLCYKLVHSRESEEEEVKKKKKTIPQRWWRDEGLTEWRDEEIPPSQRRSGVSDDHMTAFPNPGPKSCFFKQHFRTIFVCFRPMNQVLFLCLPLKWHCLHVVHLDDVTK